MKRTLALATFAALLYDRHRRVERRQLAWKRQRDEELERWSVTANGLLERSAKDNHDWSTKLIKEVEKAMKGAMS